MTKSHTGMPTRAALFRLSGRGLADDGVIAAGRNGLLVTGLSLLEESPTQRHVVNPDGRLWLVGGEQEVWDVFLELHFCWVGFGVVLW